MGFLWMLIAHLLLIVMVESQSYPISLPGCPDKCGNVAIPYPFGTQPGCYLDENFFIHCDTTFDPPKAFFEVNDMNVTEIMLSSGEMRIWAYIAHQCFDKSGTPIAQQTNLNTSITLHKFPLSYSKNKFTTVGCDVYAYFTGSQSTYTGCTIVCWNLADVVNGTCTGLGCCQMSVPKLAMGTNITLGSFQNHTHISSFDPCSYAFVVEEAAYTFNSLDYLNPTKLAKLPVILDWMIGNQTCKEAKKDPTSYACKANSYCYDSDNGPGYRCNCSQGYEGNPYLPTGCQDIDECKVSQPCNVTCINLPGSYQCSCPKGYIGDGRKDGIGCISTSTSSMRIQITLGIGVGIGSIVLLFTCYCVYRTIKRSMEKRQRIQNFNRNGGMLLQQVTSDSDIMETTKIFTSWEMQKATDNYNKSRILGQGGQGTVYKGMLDDGRIVAIKKSKRVDEKQLRQFINEVVVLSKINHRNVVKLIGCCLETQVPLLVYEYVPNGTLHEHIHDPGQDFHLTWKMRLQIATELAGALAYLHSASSVPVYHRDIKSSNILLDDKYRAKISDFGIARNISIGQTHLSTCVQGTFGYLDPEYFRSHKFTEKSDVYSFGIVLAELLTSKKPISSETGTEEPKSLAVEFLSVMENCFGLDMMDPQVLKEGRDDEVQNVANLVCQCLNMIGKYRPTMKEVVMILEGIRSSQTPNQVEEIRQESDTILGQLRNAYRRPIWSSISSFPNGGSYSTITFLATSYDSTNSISQDPRSCSIDVHSLLNNTM